MPDMSKPKKTPTNPYAWTEADYDERGYGRLSLRFPKPFLTCLDRVSKRLKLSRSAAIQKLVTEFDREPEK